MTTRRVGHLLVMSSVVLSVFLWGTSWVVAQGSVAQSQSAAQGTENQTPAAKSGSTAQHKAEKEKHWSGSLVDALGYLARGLYTKGDLTWTVMLSRSWSTTSLTPWSH
jgi:hypothetical protein